MKRHLLLFLALAAVLAGTGSSDSAQAAQSSWKTCGVPADTFYFSLRVHGTTCHMGQKVLLKARCTNAPRCSHRRYGPWRCRVSGPISEWITVCRRGERRIVARAAGD